MATRIETDPDLVRPFLSDAAHVPGGAVRGVVSPASLEELVTVVASSGPMLVVGAQSSLTGGATPRGELVVSTRALRALDIDPARRLARVGAGISLRELQDALAQHGLWYPPAPTFDGASVGGTVATNAAGAATFKYGTTRRWVDGLTLVLADGSVLSVRRGTLTATDIFRIPVGTRTLTVPTPRYVMPAVPKLSAGYFSQPGMDLVDLMVGSEGTLAVVADVTLRLIDRPTSLVAFIVCRDDGQAFALTHALRAEAIRAWHGEAGLDVSAVEYMDARSLSFVDSDAFARCGMARPPAEAPCLLVQIEVDHDDEGTLDAFERVLATARITSDPLLAGAGDYAAAAKLFELREAVPAGVNSAIAGAKSRDAAIQKMAGDFIVPAERLEESVALYRQAFEGRGLDYAIWGHASDGNLHPNVVPRSAADVESARDVLAQLAQRVIELGGAPMAEHGVGRNPLKQQFLRTLVGDTGIAQMRDVKRALDPEWKLAPGVLFPA